MRASTTVIVVIMACIAISSAIPAPEESKTLKDQVRQKRGGWGYETAFIQSAPLATTILGPSKTVISSPQVVHTAIAAPATAVVVPQKVATVATSAIAVPASHTESFVYHSAPDHSYYIHQRHPSSYYYYHHPVTQYYYDPYYAGVSSVPVLVSG